MGGCDEDEYGDECEREGGEENEEQDEGFCHGRKDTQTTTKTNHRISPSSFNNQQISQFKTK
jgi:hypothetical protein